MTKTTYTENIQMGTDADFRSWGQNLSNAIQAVGLVKTADTGQVDWTTVTKPAGITTSAGYEIYKFNDSLAASSPIYFRVDYGTGSNANTVPRVWLTVGTGSNGAGVITGPQSSINILVSSGPTANNSAQTWVCFSADGAFTLVWAAKYNTGNGCLLMTVIDRARDDSGNPLGEGFLVTSQSPGATNPTQVAVQTGAAPTSLGPGVPNCLVPNTSSSAVGSDIQLFRHWLATPRLRPVIGLLTYLDPEIGAGSVISVAPFGVAHSYLTLGKVYCTANFHITTAANCVAAILWE